MKLPEMPKDEPITTAKFISKCSIWCLDYFVDLFNQSLKEVKAQGVKSVTVEDVLQNFHIHHQNFRVILEDTVEKAAKIALSSKRIDGT